MILSRNQIFTVVCNIRIPQADGGEKIGTGIFIEKDNKCYLVTAEHVARETDKNSYIIYCDSSSNSLKRDLLILNTNLSWKHHPTADISCLEIDIANNFDLLNGRCYPYTQIEFNTNTITRDEEITCVGFPCGLGVNGKFTPFTFRSFFSSNLVTFPRFDTKILCDFLCLENPSVGGYSGGPVFDLGYRIVGAISTNTSDTRLYGVMHGTLEDETGGKIAAVTPIKYLNDII